MRRHALLLASGFWLLAFVSPLAARQGPTPQPAIAAPTAPQGRPGQAPSAPRPNPQPTPMGVPGVPPPRGEMGMQVPPAPPRAEQIPTQNVKIDIVITDSAAPAKKTVTMITAEGRNGRVRSQRGNIMLNVDAHPQVLRDGRIQLSVTLEYMSDPGSGGTSMINESLSFLAADGKPTTVSQSADPTSDRKVTVDVTATIVK